jgi:hypothetical protein
MSNFLILTSGLFYTQNMKKTHTGSMCMLEYFQYLFTVGGTVLVRFQVTATGDHSRGTATAAFFWPVPLTPPLPNLTLNVLSEHSFPCATDPEQG